MMTGSGQRLILHVDMDAFFASIEQMDNPELRAKPVIVGGLKNRGVVSTASYEARRFGVHSAVAMSKARRLCPHGIFLPVRMARYQQISRTIMDLLSEFSPMVEPISIDEAFVDMTGSEYLFGPPMAMAESIKEKIKSKTGLSCSVGVACNKFLAKLASDLEKPDAITIVPSAHEREFIAPLPVKKLWGVGPKAEAKLMALGLSTIGDIAQTDPALLQRHMGSLGLHIHDLSMARDDRVVAKARDRQSIGHERTLEQDISGFEAVEDMVRDACRHIAKDLRKKDTMARAVRIKIRYSDTFQLATRDTRLALPCQDSTTLFNHARQLLDRLDLSRPIRLVGATAFELQGPDGPAQGDLFLSRDSEKNTKLERTMDAIRDKFGDKIKRGTER